MPEFEKEKVFKSSTAAGNLSIWIRTVLQTNEALKIVDPKKMELQQAEAKYKRTVALLKEKKKALSAILSLIKELEKVKIKFNRI
jgi:dynein heavy chain